MTYPLSLSAGLFYAIIAKALHAPDSSFGRRLPLTMAACGRTTGRAEMAGDILDFNMSDGIAPLIMQKLNSNFRNLRNLIRDPEVVIASGATAPDPRTDETLWYNTETGELSVWAQQFDLSTGQYTGEWDWSKPTLNSILVGQDDPTDPDNPIIPPPDCFLYYNTDTHMVWIYQFQGGASTPSWASFGDAVAMFVYWKFFHPDGEYHRSFVQAVQAAIDESPQ